MNDGISSRVEEGKELTSTAQYVLVGVLEGKGIRCVYITSLRDVGMSGNKTVKETLV